VYYGIWNEVRLECLMIIYVGALYVSEKSLKYVIKMSLYLLHARIHWIVMTRADFVWELLVALSSILDSAGMLQSCRSINAEKELLGVLIAAIDVLKEQKRTKLIAKLFKVIIIYDSPIQFNVCMLLVLIFSAAEGILERHHAN
jgi:hypothetical protein